MCDRLTWASEPYYLSDEHGLKCKKACWRNKCSSIKFNLETLVYVSLTNQETVMDVCSLIRKTKIVYTFISFIQNALENKSTQRVYNTLQKCWTLSPLFLPSSSFFSLGKMKEFLPCLVASCIGVYFPPVHPHPLSLPIFSPPFFFLSVSNVQSEYGGNLWQRAYIKRSM